MNEYFWTGPSQDARPWWIWWPYIRFFRRFASRIAAACPQWAAGHMRGKIKKNQLEYIISHQHHLITLWTTFWRAVWIFSDRTFTGGSAMMDLMTVHSFFCVFRLLNCGSSSSMSNLLSEGLIYGHRIAHILGFGATDIGKSMIFPIWHDFDRL